MAVFQSRENANLAKLIVLPEIQPAVSTSSTEVPTGKADTRNRVRSHSLHEEPVQFHGILYRKKKKKKLQVLCRIATLVVQIIRMTKAAPILVGIKSLMKVGHRKTKKTRRMPQRLSYRTIQRKKDVL